MKNSRVLKCLGLLLLGAGCAWPGVLYFAGDLRTNGNITACGVGCTLSPGDSDGTWAQWAAFSVPFTVVAPSTMNAITFGYGGGTSDTGAVVLAGGLEPYLSLFDSSGNFLASTFSGITCPAGAGMVGGNCFDVELDGGLLKTGTYTLVLSAYMNMSLAENSGVGLLSDGFTGLGNLGANESLAYAFDINLTSTTPEPGSLAGLATGLALLALRLRTVRRRK
jgi:hypothetical protein